MAQTKYVDQEGLKVIKNYYDGELGKKVNVEEGKSLIEDEKVTKLDGIEEKAQVNKVESIEVGGVAATIDEQKKATVDLTAVLEPYAKTADIQDVLDKADKIINLQADPITKEDLATKKDEAQKFDAYIVSDDDNHIYVFLGEGSQGADANGFYDIGGHVDLTGVVKSEQITDMLTKTEAEKTYLKISGAVEQIQSQLQETFLTKEEAETTYVKTTDLVAMTEAEIKSALGIVE